MPRVAATAAAAAPAAVARVRAAAGAAAAPGPGERQSTEDTRMGGKEDSRELHSSRGLW